VARSIVVVLVFIVVLRVRGVCCLVRTSRSATARPPQTNAQRSTKSTTSLQRIFRRCLPRDPVRSFHIAGALRARHPILVENAQRGGATASASRVRAPRRAPTPVW